MVKNENLQEDIAIHLLEGLVKEFDDERKASEEYNGYMNFYLDKGYSRLDSHNYDYNKLKRVLDEGR